MKSYYFVVLLALLGLVACGSDSDSSSGGGEQSSSQSEVQELVEATPGTYYTVLRPVNFHANGFIPYGMATFTLENDQLQVSTTLDDDQAVAHRQTLHMGTRCPTMADDTNGDGLIDYAEAIAVVGLALMPLDNDLSSQMAGEEVYPRGPGMTYNKTASLTSINADLWAEDEDSTDNFMKLPKNQGIGFEDRVVLVHGTSFQNSFPSSLASHESEEAHVSLPVVCGILKKMD